MRTYGAASYQQDVMDAFSKHAQVYFYGPGFIGYDKNDSIGDVVAKVSFNPDVVILGHAWLCDNEGSEVDPHPRLKLSQTTLPKVVILNKEYTNIDAKLEYIKRGKFDFGFTHHHNTKRYSFSSDTKFIFWPFAYDPQRFKYFKNGKTIDLGFSGILQNLNKNAKQSDIRLRIMKHLFLTFLEVPLDKRRRFKQMKIFWNSICRKKSGRYLSALLGKRKHLTNAEYAKLIQNSKIFINTLSPVGLLSPRFFECMASGSLVFCEESELYQNIFPNDVYVAFKSDLSDFDQKLFHFLNNDVDRNKIIEKAYDFVKTKHTWSKRVTDLLNTVGKI